MDIRWEIDNDTVTVGVSGKLNTPVAMNIDDRFMEMSGEIRNIYFDFDGLQYISSAGLRILYWALQYTGKKGGRMCVRNVSPEVLEVFNVTGLADSIPME
jgi:anti-anti-sigma factor